MTNTGPDMTGNHHISADTAVQPDVTNEEHIDDGSIRDDLEEAPEDKRNRAQAGVDDEGSR